MSCGLFASSTIPFLIHKVPRPKGSSFWLPTIQIIASFNFLLSLLVMLFKTLSFCILLFFIVNYHCVLNLFYLHTDFTSCCVVSKAAFVYGPVYSLIFSLISKLLLCAHFCLYINLCQSQFFLVSVWVNGLLGFGLLLSFHLIQAAHLYFIFVKLVYLSFPSVYLIFMLSK